MNNDQDHNMLGVSISEDEELEELTEEELMKAAGGAYWHQINWGF